MPSKPWPPKAKPRPRPPTKPSPHPRRSTPAAITTRGDRARRRPIAAKAGERARAGPAATTPARAGPGKKYKKCHLPADEQATLAPPAAPDAQELLANGWRLFEQRRPGRRREGVPSGAGDRRRACRTPASASAWPACRPATPTAPRRSWRRLSRPAPTRPRRCEKKGAKDGFSPDRGAALHPGVARARLPGVRRGQVRGRGQGAGARARHRRRQRRRRSPPDRRQGADEAGKAGRRRDRAGAGGQARVGRQPGAARPGAGALRRGRRGRRRARRSKRR